MKLPEFCFARLKYPFYKILSWLTNFFANPVPAFIYRKANFSFWNENVFKNMFFLEEKKGWGREKASRRMLLANIFWLTKQVSWAKLGLPVAQI